MSKYLGDYIQSGSLDFMFHTTTFGSSAPVTFSGSPALTVYKGNSAVQSNAGITLQVDFDGVTGQHHARISLTNAFYATANDYNVQVSAGTVEGQTQAGINLRTFSIENRSTTKIETDTQNIQSRLPATLVGGAMDADVSAIQAGAITAAAIATDAIDADSIKADAVTEIQSGLATTVNVSAVETDTQDIQGRLPVALVSGKMDSDMTAISGDTTAADNLESALDGTGGVTLSVSIADLTRAVQILDRGWIWSGTQLAILSSDGSSPWLTATVKDKSGNVLNSSAMGATTIAQRSALS